MYTYFYPTEQATHVLYSVGKSIKRWWKPSTTYKNRCLHRVSMAFPTSLPAVWALLKNTVWFFLPAYIANASPILIAKIPGLQPYNCPIDADKTWRGKPVLGPHKTLWGTVGGVFFGTVTGVVMDYVGGYPVALAYALSLGAILGDLVKSFFKRRLGKESGASWPVFDQVDYVVGAATIAWVFNYGELSLFVAGLLLAPVLNLAANTAAYVLGVKDVWW